MKTHFVPFVVVVPFCNFGTAPQGNIVVLAVVCARCVCVCAPRCVLQGSIRSSTVPFAFHVQPTNKTMKMRLLLARDSHLSSSRLSMIVAVCVSVCLTVVVCVLDTARILIIDHRPHTILLCVSVQTPTIPTMHLYINKTHTHTQEQVQQSAPSE